MESVNFEMSSFVFLGEASMALGAQGGIRGIGMGVQLLREQRVDSLGSLRPERYQ